MPPPVARAASETGDPLLLTPGPLTTSRSVKQAMLHDWGSRDADFIAHQPAVRERARRDRRRRRARMSPCRCRAAAPSPSRRCSSTFVPRDRQGAAPRQRRLWPARAPRSATSPAAPMSCYETPEDTPPDLGRGRSGAGADPAITHVFAVHCETTSGILNPIEEIAALVARRGRRLLVDAMSAFGALPVDAAASAVRCARRLVATNASKACRAWASSSAARRRWKRAKGNAHHAQCSTCTTSGRRWRRPGSGASRRRSTSSSPCTRRWRSIRAEGGVAGRGAALSRELPHPGRRHARARLRDAAARRAAGADHRHLPHAGTIRASCSRPSTTAQGARLRDLSRQAHRGRQLPHRLHRPARCRPHARRARGGARGPGRDGRRASVAPAGAEAA